MSKAKTNIYEIQKIDLPSSWIRIQIGDVCSTTSGGTPSRKINKYYKGVIPWAKSGELNDGLVSDIEEYITDEAIANSSVKVFPSGTLLIALYGATVGKLGILTKDAATNQAVCAIFPSERVNKKYLFWYLRYIRSDLIASAIGGAQPNISQGIIKNTVVPIAPINEQKHIVAEIEKQFSRLDEAVDNLKRVKANLKRYKASVLKAAVEGKLTEEWRKKHPNVEPADKLLQRILAERRKKWEEVELAKMRARGKEPKDNKWKKKYKKPAVIDEGILPDIPESWIWVSAEAICSSVRDGTHDTPKYVESGVPLITSKNLSSSGMEFSNTKLISHEDYVQISKRSGVDKGDVLFAMIGTIGNPVVVKSKRKFSIKNVGLFKKNKPFLHPEYLKIWLESPVLIKWITPRLKGTTQKFSPLGLLRALAVALLPYKEQNEIIIQVEEKLSITDKFELVVDNALNRTERLRQSILRNAFSGRLNKETNYIPEALKRAMTTLSQEQP